MTDELICNDVSLDLNGAMPIPLNFSIADVKDPSKRKRNFSKEIELPGTATNNDFMRNVFSFTSTAAGVNFDPTQKVTVRYLKRGITVLPSAVLQLKEVTIENGYPVYTVNLYSETVDYFLLLSQITVQELDWSAYDHTLSRANIKASWLGAAGSGYYYPLIDRGTPRPGATIFNTTDLVPYVHLREVFYKALEWAGFEIDSSFTESTRFKNVLFGFGGGNLPTIPATDLAQRRVTVNSGVFNLVQERIANNPQAPGVIPNVSGYIYTNPFGTWINSSTEVTDTLDQFDGTDIEIQRSGNYHLSTTFILDAVFTVTNGTFVSAEGARLFIRKNGAVIATIGSGSTSSATPTFDLSVGVNLYANSGDVISYGLAIDGAKATPTGTAFVEFDVTITSSTIAFDLQCIDATLTDGGIVQIGRFLPAMKCSELVLGCIRQFNLYTSEPTNNEIKAEPLSNYYTNTNVFTDITQIVDYSQPIKVRPSANEYAKNIIFKFKEMKERDALIYAEKWGEAYGDLNYEQGSYYAKGDMKIELPWSTIIPYEIAPGILVPRFINIDDNGTVKPNTGAPRIMMRNGMKLGAWTFRNTDNPASQEQLTEYPCVHHFDNWNSPTFDLNFKLVSELFYTAYAVTTVNSYSEYYAGFINEMTSPAGKIVNLFVKWHAQQMKSMNFGRLLMIDGALFRLNEIKDFDDEKQASAETELIKVLKAKRARRKTIPIVSGTTPTLGVDTTTSPIGVGEDTGVISGGKNIVSLNSIKIKG